MFHNIHVASKWLAKSQNDKVILMTTPSSHAEKHGAEAESSDSSVQSTNESPS